ncbi:MAG: hypothetical protein FJZ00_00435 [Candidatus Sericytochromatia bacterium]|uniref:Uncharacterized protein n=1 Tax=Candidatus Tanganyikabacteria bacterium TaxID=2961651 RepID=A0A938BHN9_9BACT|nr:hypothetical protein [Candidatus Tanganyikabacteria bacterium]
MARPSKLTPEVQEAIVGAIAGGATREGAAQAVGVSPAALYNWLKRGRDGVDSAYVEFLEAVTCAEGAFEVNLISKIKELGEKGAVGALQWLAERRIPERWGQRQQVLVLVRNEIEGFFGRLRQGLTEEEYSRVLEVAASAVELDDGEVLELPSAAAGEEEEARGRER